MKARVASYWFKSFFSKKVAPKSFLYNGFRKFVEYSKLDIFKLLNLIPVLFSILVIFSRSADFDGCVKLINKREVIIIFFDINEIKINKFLIN